jgi:hypothetical protein
MTDHEESAEIQEQMAELRLCLARQSTRVGQDTRDLFDWKRQIVRHPVATAIVGCLVVYALYPRTRRKSTVVVADPAQSRNGRKLDFAYRRPASPIRALMGGLVRSGLSMLWTGAIKSALAYSQSHPNHLRNPAAGRQSSDSGSSAEQD